MPAQDASTPASVSFIAGGVAGGVEAIATVGLIIQHRMGTLLFTSTQYPFEFAKTRVQLRNQSGAASSKNPFLVVSQVFRNEGYRALYKGCSTLVVVGVDCFDCIT